MPKIPPLILAPGKAAKIVNESVAKIHGISKPDIPNVSLSDLESKARTLLDLSTEELGFYTYNGKTVNIIFPR